VENPGISELHTARSSSQTVTHPSSDRAQCCLTSVILREPLYPTRQDRIKNLREKNKNNINHIANPYIVQQEAFLSSFGTIAIELPLI